MVNVHRNGGCVFFLDVLRIMRRFSEISSANFVCHESPTSLSTVKAVLASSTCPKQERPKNPSFHDSLVKMGVEEAEVTAAVVSCH